MSALIALCLHLMILQAFYLLPGLIQSSQFYNSGQWSDCVDLWNRLDAFVVIILIVSLTIRGTFMRFTITDEITLETIFSKTVNWSSIIIFIIAAIFKSYFIVLIK